MIPAPSETTPLRRCVFGLLILIAFASAVGRIASVQRVYEPAFPRAWPTTKPDSNAMFGSNDRARWATIRALVHGHSYVIGKRNPELAWQSKIALFAGSTPLEAAVLAQAGYDVRTDVANPNSHSGIIFQKGLKEHGWATIDRVLDPNTLEFHSTKPPLLSTLLAGIYWIFLNLFGWDLTKNPTTVVRAMLLLVNALPFAGYLWLLAQVAERWGKSDWGKLFVVACGAFATTVTPFLISLQNHTFGTFAVMLAWWSLLCAWDKIQRRETPGWQHLVSAGFFASFAAAMELPALSFLAACFVLFLWWCPLRTLLLFVPLALIPAAAFFATNYADVGRWWPVQSNFGNEWYRYEGSYWNPAPEGTPAKTGIDWAKDHETRGEYIFHVLIGHHGVFSLTPIWLLAAAGMIAGCWRWRRGDDFPWFVQPAGLAISVVVIGFYVMNNDSRNYGGFTNGLRWLMWLTPIWLTCMIPTVDWLAQRRWGRWLCGICLALSVFSMSYQLWNPWRHPWIFDLMIELGWKGY